MIDFGRATTPDGREVRVIPDEDGYPSYVDEHYGGTLFRVVVKHGDRIVYALQPKQWECLKLTPLLRPVGAAGPTRIGYGGAAGGAKSHLARAVATMAAHLWPGSTGIIFRKTRDEVRKNHLVPFRRELPREMWSWNGQDMEIYWKATGSRTLLGYLRHEEDVERYQGDAFDYMIFEEATHQTWSKVSWLVNQRLRASVEGTHPFALFPTNPGNVGHLWFRRLFIDRRFNPDLDEQPDDHAFVQAKLGDNAVLQRRDPKYIRRLNQLPSPLKEWFRDGDFTAGSGMALPELDRAVHFIRPFVPPAHWQVFAGYDPGFQHPFSFVWYTVDEDGRVYVGDRITGRRMHVPDIVERIRERMAFQGVPMSRVAYVAAGHDAWDVHEAHALLGPTEAERLIAAGLPLIKADRARVAGLRNMREYTAWKGRGPNGEDDDPLCYFMRTQGCSELFDVLESRVPDPDNVEDVLKTDADEFGEGGDDDYDSYRYGLMTRPARALQLMKDEDVQAWAPSTLIYEQREGMRVRPTPAPGPPLDPMLIENL